MNLLPRFYAATSGAVRIDGHDVRDVTLRSLREQMAIVTQETILFNDTIWNNLCYGQPEHAERKEWLRRRKRRWRTISSRKCRKGYQTLIGDRGQRLSGGQRQRLAIARALLKDAPILILDEATSELDSESEMLVQSALNNLMTGRTVFVIAHRLSTIRRADLIAVLEAGTIRERGTHEELAGASRHCTRGLYDMQFQDAEPASRTAESGVSACPSPDPKSIAANAAKPRRPASLKSMTGYAQARAVENGWSLRVTIRSVNHRFLDLHLRIPEGFEPLEPRIRQTSARARAPRPSGCDFVLRASRASGGGRESRTSPRRI